MQKFKKKLVSIGNLTVGGTGKTPFVIFLVQLFKSSDKKVAVVSRGYKRRDKNRLIDMMSDSNADAGDEPWLIAKRGDVPVVVSRNKREGCDYAIDKYEPDVIILDDGFQSFSLEKDLDILLLDSTDNLLDEFLLPAGRLREPLGAIKRADVVIITRSDQAEKNQIQRILKRVRRYNLNTPIFLSVHHPLSLIKLPENNVLKLSSLKGERMLSLSGIGNHQSFLSTLKSIDLNVVHSVNYIDHHTYSKENIKRINRLVELHRINAIVTTEKDIYSLRHYINDLRVPVYLLQIELRLQELDEFKTLLQGKGLI